MLPLESLFRELNDSGNIRGAGDGGAGPQGGVCAAGELVAAGQSWGLSDFPRRLDPYPRLRAISILVLGEPRSAGRMLALLAIVGGIVGLKLASPP
ncbi:MAG: hypothetical protein H0W29_01235 [Gemmatimonadales bacterium]|nr:hypothetical protein [Gemmatimonadales bacterium]